jgi:hypothetical protein
MPCADEAQPDSTALPALFLGGPALSFLVTAVELNLLVEEEVDKFRSKKRDTW